MRSRDPGRDQDDVASAEGAAGGPDRRARAGVAPPDFGFGVAPVVVDRRDVAGFAAVVLGVVEREVADVDRAGLGLRAALLAAGGFLAAGLVAVDFAVDFAAVDFAVDFAAVDFAMDFAAGFAAAGFVAVDFAAEAFAAAGFRVVRAPVDRAAGARFGAASVAADEPVVAVDVGAATGVRMGVTAWLAWAAADPTFRAAPEAALVTVPFAEPAAAVATAARRAARLVTSVSDSAT